MIPRIGFIFAITVLSTMSAHAQQAFPLWPDRLPNSRGIAVQEVEENQRLRVVSRPELLAFFPHQEANSGISVIVCPGGGYGRLAIHKEGYQVAKWLNTVGINAFVLKYRLPTSPDVQVPHQAPLQDAQRAIKLVRQLADSFQLNPDRVGIMGFSAGGHLAASAGVHAQHDWSLVGDEVDAHSCRPDFLMLIYPVISLEESLYHGGSRNNLLGPVADQPALQHQFSLHRHVSEDTPPTFLVHAHDDGAVVPEHSLRFYEALRAHEVPAALYIFPQGGHGFGLGLREEQTHHWPRLCEAWMQLQLGLER